MSRYMEGYCGEPPAIVQDIGTDDGLHDAAASMAEALALYGWIRMGQWTAVPGTRAWCGTFVSNCDTATPPERFTVTVGR